MDSDVVCVCVRAQNEITEYHSDSEWKQQIAKLIPKFLNSTGKIVE